MARASANQLDFFVVDTIDFRAKHVLDLMQRNLFGLSKKKRTEPIVHEEKGSFIKITGDDKHGIATVFDQDLIIFLISVMVDQKNKGQPVNRGIDFSGYEYWQFVGKNRFSGSGYEKLWASMERLHHTHIETDIRVKGDRRNHKFTWLTEIEQRWEDEVRDDEGRLLKKGKHIGYRAVVPEWLADAVTKEKPWVVTLNHQYFKITSPIERWLYLYARKSAGKQELGWQESIDSLYEKSASTNSKDQFERSVRNILSKRENRVLEYEIKREDTIGRSVKRGLRFTRSKFLPTEQQRTRLTYE